MTIGIIVALEKEISIFLTTLKITQIKYINKIKIIWGLLNNKKIILIISGIGKVCASIATTIISRWKKIKYIINIGTAGILMKKYKYHNIFFIEKFYYHDFDLTSFNYNIGHIPQYPKYFTSNNKILIYFKKKLLLYKKKYYTGNIVTGDTFLHTKKQINKIYKLFKNITLVDMEATSIAQTCFIFNKPFISIKIISDYANFNSSKIFKKNITINATYISDYLNLLIK